MRSWVALLVACGIGCSSSSRPASPVGPASNNGDNGNGADMAVAGGSVDMAVGAGGGGGGGGGGAGDMAMANPAGPWPIADLTVYPIGAILDANPDDGQNIWAASGTTLYLLRPGTTTWQTFTAADGLHIQPFTDPYGNPNTTTITAIAAGHANEVFVGYYGYESLGNPYLDTDAQKALGNADRVVVGSDGKLQIVRYAFHCDYEGGNGCWEDRSVRRAVYAHTGVAAGHAFLGFNHGVSHVFNDSIGDHVHPEIWYHADMTTMEKLGEFYGLALTPDGGIWCAGRYGVGLQPFNATPHYVWTMGHFIYAFTTNTSDHGLDVAWGYREDNRGAAVTPDGRLWLARLGGGLVVWDPATGNYGTMHTVSGPPSDLVDVQADPDGTLWLVSSGGSLYRFDPAAGALKTWPGVGGVTRIYVDSTVTPRAVYAAMSGGLAVIRAK